MDSIDKDLVFSRQSKIEDWNQTKIQEQVALILGVGGLGSIILINLLRLGVKKIFLVDFDHIAHLLIVIKNINCLRDDVGVQKVIAAKRNSQHFNVGGTEIVDFDIDAVLNWQKVVEMAQQSSVIFNCIDHGDHWDAAVQSLCISLNIPHLIGGSYAQSFMAEIYFKAPCYACLDEMLLPEILTLITPDKIQSIQSLEFLPKNNKPQGQSHISLCSACGNFVTQLFVNYLNQLEKSSETKKIIFYMTTFESVQFELEAKKDCKFCVFNNKNFE